MFTKATDWELKFGRVASIIFSLLFCYLFLNHFDFLSNFDDTFDDLTDKMRVISFSFNFVFYSTIVVAWVFFRNALRDQRLYPLALLVYVIAVTASIFIDMHHPLIKYFFQIRQAI